MTVIILSLAALGVVAVIAAIASRWDKGQPDEDPDRRAAAQRTAVLTTAAMASMKKKSD